MRAGLGGIAVALRGIRSFRAVLPTKECGMRSGPLGIPGLALVRCHHEGWRHFQRAVVMPSKTSGGAPGSSRIGFGPVPCTIGVGGTWGENSERTTVPGGGKRPCLIRQCPFLIKEVFSVWSGGSYLEHTNVSGG